jgi:hypothetical protein
MSVIMFKVAARAAFQAAAMNGQPPYHTTGVESRKPNQAGVSPNGGSAGHRVHHPVMIMMLAMMAVLRLLGVLHVFGVLNLFGVLHMVRVIMMRVHSQSLSDRFRGIHTRG